MNRHILNGKYIRYVPYCLLTPSWTFKCFSVSTLLIFLIMDQNTEGAGSDRRRLVQSTSITSCESGCWTCNPSSSWLWSNYLSWWKVFFFTPQPSPQNVKKTMNFYFNISFFTKHSSNFTSITLHDLT